METKTIYQALLEAQKEIEPVIKDANNPFFKSDYATLGAVIDAVKPALNNAGISIIQSVQGSIVVTKLIYIDGKTIEDCGTPIICSKPNDPQAQGSAITYARRYGLMSLLCLSAEDDDGENATSHPTPYPLKPTEAVKTIPVTANRCTVCGGAATPPYTICWKCNNDKKLPVKTAE